MAVGATVGRAVGVAVGGIGDGVAVGGIEVAVGAVRVGVMVMVAVGATELRVLLSVFVGFGVGLKDEDCTLGRGAVGLMAVAVCAAPAGCGALAVPIGVGDTTTRAVTAVDEALGAACPPALAGALVGWGAGGSAGWLDAGPEALVGSAFALSVADVALSCAVDWLGALNTETGGADARWLLSWLIV